MNKKFLIAISLAVTSALVLTSLALAAQPAHVIFTTDAPCAVNVLVDSYTDPTNLSGQTTSGLTPLTLDTFPSTTVTFFYSSFVVCNGVTYHFVSSSPSNPLTSGAEDSTTTVTGHYALPDSTPPVWTVPANFSFEATGSTGAVVTYTASASDPDDAVSSQSCLPASGSTFPLGTTSVNCTATDTHNNTGTASFNITVTDTTQPTVTVPSNMTVMALSASGAPVSFTASANDLVDGSVTVTCFPASGATFALGTTIVNCSATDTHSNTGFASFTVAVVDNASPVLTLPSDMIVTALSASGAPVNFTASANDAVDGPVAVICSPASGATFPLGATTVNCSATDAHGNKSSGSFTVTVVDNASPILTLPSDIKVTALNASGAIVSFTASANDVVDGLVAVTCSPASGSLFPIGTTTVNCSATDSHDNNASGSFSVIVLDDTTPPVLTLPSGMTVNALNASGAIVSFTASAIDAIDGPVSVTCSPASGSSFPIGLTIVNCSATDAYGNKSSGSFTVTVVDNIPPVLTLPSDMAVTAVNASGAIVSFTASANDVVDGPVAVTCSPVSGSIFPIGTTTVNCSATDSYDNNTSGSFIISVQYANAGTKCKGVSGHEILQPINLDGSSVFNAGSTVPAKFRVCGLDGNAIGTPDVVANFSLIQIISQDTVTNVHEAVLSTTPDDVFRSGNGQWIFNISTKNLSADNTYVYLITLNDGSFIEFRFTLK